jgi:hypothetical protein
LGLQQGLPVPPHCEHTVVPRRQEDWDAVHVEKSQHGSDTLPHEAPASAVWHDPLVQVPGKLTMGGAPGWGGGAAQVSPFPRHTPATQQPPVLHTLAAQHP